MTVQCDCAACDGNVYEVQTLVPGEGEGTTIRDYRVSFMKRKRRTKHPFVSRFRISILQLLFFLFSPSTTSRHNYILSFGGNSLFARNCIFEY